MKNFLFVSGCDRSGTTAFVKLMNKHPDIALGMERYKGFIGSDIENLQPERFLKPNFFNIQPDETNISWPYFYDPLIDKFDNSKLIGDKVPRYFQHYNHLHKVFPKAKHLFLLRDPFAVASSWKNRAEDSEDTSWRSTNDVRKAIEVWNNSLTQAYKWCEAGKISLRVVSYESFFSGETDDLVNTLDFLSLPNSTELTKSFKEISKGWKHRNAKQLSLNTEECNHVSQSANFRLAKSLTRKHGIGPRDS